MSLFSNKNITSLWAKIHVWSVGCRLHITDLYKEVEDKMCVTFSNTDN